MPNSDNRTLPHIFLPGYGDRENFTSPNGGGGEMELPQRDRARHAAKLRRDIAAAVDAAQAQLAARDPGIAAGTEGFYLEFQIPVAQAAIVDRLENKQGRNPIELVAVRPMPDDPERHVLATVFVPSARRDFYDGKVNAYENQDQVSYLKGADQQYITDQDGNRIEKSRRPKNEALVASVDAVRLAPLHSLFTDDLALFPPARREIWWEIWLRSGMQQTMMHAAGRLGIAVREHAVRFAEREVILARATPEALMALVKHTDAVAELRLNRDTPAFFMQLEPAEQLAWVADTVARLTPPPDDAPGRVRAR